MTHKPIETALLKQLLTELQRMSNACELEGDKHGDGNKWHRLSDDAAKAITAGRAALANAEHTHKEILDLLRGEQMLSAITVLLNVAAFGSTPLYEDGSETENRLLQLKTAKFLHSLHSDGVFEEEHEWLLNQVKLHERYAEPFPKMLSDILKDTP